MKLVLFSPPPPPSLLFLILPSRSYEEPVIVPYRSWGPCGGGPPYGHAPRHRVWWESTRPQRLTLKAQGNTLVHRERGSEEGMHNSEQACAQSTMSGAHVNAEKDKHRRRLIHRCRRAHPHTHPHTHTGIVPKSWEAMDQHRPAGFPGTVHFYHTELFIKNQYFVFYAQIWSTCHSAIDIFQAGRE